MSNFQALEVVDRASETQPQVLKKLNKLPEQDILEVVDRCSETQP